MVFRRPLVPAALTTAVTVLLAVGCSASSTADMAQAPAGPPEQTQLIVQAVPTTDSAGLYIAQYQGLFAKAGLNVTIEPAISAESSINQLAANKIQILSGNYVSFIEAQINHDQGKKAVNVPFPPGPTPQQISADVDIFAEASVMQPGFVGLFTPRGSKIAKISQLTGKTIGINAPGNVAYLLLASFMQANGLTPPTVNSNLLKFIPFPVMEQNLLAHKVDVAFLAEPFISISEDTAGVAQLTNLDEGATAAFPIQCYATTKSFAQAHPNTMAAFEHALQEGQQIATDDRQIAERAMVKYGLLPNMPQKTPVQFANQIASIMQFETYPIGQVDPIRVQRVVDVVKQFGVFNIPSNFDVKEMLRD